MREKRSYDQYYDNTDKNYICETRKGVGMFGVFVISFCACGVGYIAGYKKARATTKTILDTIFEKYPDHKDAFKKVWNVAVDEYFDKK